MKKTELRRHFLYQRKQLSEVYLQTKSQAISRVFFASFDLNAVQYLHLFLPILRFNEINTWYIIDNVWQNHPDITLVTTNSNLNTGEMTHHFFDANTEIGENNWGIPTPIQATQCSEAMLDIVLIPLLCFDKQGYRVGYGKGYYDKFLQRCRTDSFKIGLSLFEPVKKIEEIMPYDVKMDACIMPEGTFIF